MGRDVVDELELEGNARRIEGDPHEPFLAEHDLDRPIGA